MYPETDVPPVRVTRALLAEVDAIPVELPEQWVARVSARHGLSPAQAWQLLNRGQEDEFEALVARHDPRLVGRALLSVLPELENDGVDTAGASLDVLDDVLSGILRGLYSKEAVGDVLRRMLAGRLDAAAAARSLGFEGGEDMGVVRARIAAIVAERADFVHRRGKDAVGPLMGAVMAELKGKVDGKLLSAMLAEAIDAELARAAK
jgi:glutamyl-tRNA(Gln) amidotransferase subunit E